VLVAVVRTASSCSDSGSDSAEGHNLCGFVLHKVGSGSVRHCKCSEVRIIIPYEFKFLTGHSNVVTTIFVFFVCGCCSYSGVWLITRCGSLVRSGYNIEHETLCIVVLVANGVLFRCVAFFCMVIFQKH
jgi:hypothetical protein